MWKQVQRGKAERRNERNGWMGERKESKMVTGMDKCDVALGKRCAFALLLVKFIWATKFQNECIAYRSYQADEWMYCMEVFYMYMCACARDVYRIFKRERKNVNMKIVASHSKWKESNEQRTKHNVTFVIIVHAKQKLCWGYCCCRVCVCVSVSSIVLVSFERFMYDTIFNNILYS